MSKLGEYLCIKHGWAFKGEFFSETGSQSILTPGNFYEKGGFKYTPEKDRFYTGEYPIEYLCKKGDLIVAMTEQAAGLLGSTAIVPEDNRFLHNQRVGLIVCDEEKLLPLYAYYLFMTRPVREQIERSSSGTKVKHTSPEKIYDVCVTIPDLVAQEKIASTLWKIDSKIETNKKTCSELESLAKTLYDYWFTQFDFPNAERNPYRASGGEMVWNDQLKREIPKDWEVRKLKEIISVNGTAIQSADEYPNLPYTPIDYLPKKTMSFAGGESSESANSSLQIYEENNILLGAMRVYFHRVCIAAQRGITRSTTMVLKPHDSNSLPYAYQILNMDSTITYANKVSVGTQQPYVNWDDALDSFLFPYPSDESLIQKYCEIVWPIVNKVKALCIENHELTQLRDWLLPMLMNGQATVE